MIRHSDVCPRRTGGSCSCCPVCGEHSFAFDDRRCLYCHPSTGERIKQVEAKQPAPKVKASGQLVPIRANSRSRAPEAIRREQLYAEQMGLELGGDEDAITHA